MQNKQKNRNSNKNSKSKSRSKKYNNSNSNSYSKNSRDSNSRKRENNKKRHEDTKRQNRNDGNKREVSEKIYEDLIFGRNAVKELIAQEKDINKVWIQKNLHGFDDVVKDLKALSVPIYFVEKTFLDNLAEKHMGIIASVPPFEYSEVEDILEFAKSLNEKAFVVILDKIEDPQNLRSNN